MNYVVSGRPSDCLLPSSACCVFLLDLLEYREVLVGQLLLVGAAVQEKQAIMRAIEIGTKGNCLVQLPDGILVFLLVLIEDAEFENGPRRGRDLPRSPSSAKLRPWADPQRIRLRNARHKLIA